MKKSFVFLLTACIIFSLAACASSGSQQSSSSNANDEKIIIKFGHSQNESNNRHKAALKFKEQVDQKSNGKIEVQIYPGEQLGSEQAMLQSLTTNSIQVTAVATGLYASYDKNIGVLELPYLFEDFEQAWKVLDGPVGKEIVEPLVDKGIRVIAYWENGFRHVTNNKGPIEKPSDLSGLKIRTPEIPVSLSVLSAMGSNPIGMAYGELYTALEQNVVDGQENPLSNIYSSKIFEVQKYVSLTGHQYSPLPFAISETFWKTLSPNDQKVIEESAEEAGQLYRDLVVGDDQKLVAELQEEGMEINEVDKKPFREAVEPVYKEYVSIYGDLIEKVQDVSKQ